MIDSNYRSNIPIKKAYFLMIALVAVFSISFLGETTKDNLKTGSIDPEKHIYGVPFGISEQKLADKLGKANGRFMIADDLVGVLYGKYYLFLFKDNKLSGVKTDPYSIVRWNLVSKLANNDFLKDKRFWVLKNGIRQGHSRKEILKILGRDAHAQSDKIFYFTDKSVVTFVMYENKARSVYVEAN